MDVIKRYQQLSADLEKAKEQLARASGRREAAESELSKVVQAIRDAGFSSVAELEQAIETEESKLAEYLSQIEKELEQGSRYEG